MVINSMYGHDAMEVQEAFTKIQEQSKTLFLQPELVASALNLLNGQNLNYFQPHHQAELFRLRGICLQVRNAPVGMRPCVCMHKIAGAVEVSILEVLCGHLCGNRRDGDLASDSLVVGVG